MITLLIAICYIVQVFSIAGILAGLWSLVSLTKEADR